MEILLYFKEIRPTLNQLGLNTPEELGYDKPELVSTHPKVILRLLLFLSYFIFRHWKLCTSESIETWNPSIF